MPGFSARNSPDDIPRVTSIPIQRSFLQGFTQKLDAVFVGLGRVDSPFRYSIQWPWLPRELQFDARIREKLFPQDLNS